MFTYIYILGVNGSHDRFTRNSFMWNKKTRSGDFWILLVLRFHYSLEYMISLRYFQKI